MSLTGAVIISGTELYDTSDVAMHTPGQVGVNGYGEIFRYGKAGASAVAAGKLQLAPAPKTNHHNIAVAVAAAVGARQVTVTLGATAAVADEYAHGKMIISDAAGEGIAYRILSHPAASSAATLVLTLDRPLMEALTTSSEVTLVHNTYNGVVEGTTPTQAPAGFAVVDVAAGKYGWFLTKGISPALADEALVLGDALTTGTSTAGAVEVMDWQLGSTDATRVWREPLIGYAIIAGVDTEYRPINVCID